MIRRLLDWLLSLSGEFCGDPMCTICGPAMERTRRRLRRRRSFLRSTQSDASTNKEKP